MSDLTLADGVAAIFLLALTAYAVLAGADFGGGVWDLFASGPRVKAQRSAIAEAMGPVWEANHVWLIFLLVGLFTAGTLRVAGPPPRSAWRAGSLGVRLRGGQHRRARIPRCRARGSRSGCRSR